MQPGGKRSYPSIFIASLQELLSAKEPLSPRGLRLQHLGYFLSFPLAMILINLMNVFLPDGAVLWHLPLTAYAYFSFTAGALLCFAVFREGRIAAAARFSALCALLGFVPWFFLPDSTAAFACALLFMAGVGGCLSCASFSFVFVLNDSERFYAAALMLLVIRFVKMFPRPGQASLAGRTFALALLLPLSACMVFCREQDYGGRTGSSAAPSDHSIRLTLYLLLSYFAIRITGFYAPAFSCSPSSPFWRAAAFGLLAACIAVQALFRRSIWTLCNVFFLASILSHLLWYLGFPDGAYLFAVVKEIGFLVIFCLIGSVTGRFCDFRMHKRLILFSLSMIGLVYLGIELLQAYLPYPYTAVITAAVLFTVFLLLSPAFSRWLFFADWARELRSVRMAPVPGREDGESGATLDDTDLSPREKQVVLLMLRGMTLRQIAPELGLTASTVATYSKSIYKKLGINSRAELFLMFGRPPGVPIPTPPPKR